MKYSTQCASLSLHGQWNCVDTEINKKTKLSKGVIHKLLELAGKNIKDYHKSTPKFCKDCINKVTELYPELTVIKRAIDSDEPEHSYSKVAKLSGDDEVPSVSNCKETQTDNPIIDLNNINLDGISNEQKIKLAYALGLSEKHNVKSNCVSLGADRSLPALLSLHPDEYITAFNPVVTAFVSGLNDLEKGHATPQSSSKCDTYKLCKTLECILQLSSPTTMLPIHFRESVLLYTITGSKLALTSIGAGAHCSYQSVKSWLDSLSKNTPTFPNTDSVVAFDNNQVMKRRWKVKLNNQVQCSVVTVVVNFELRKEGDLQCQFPIPRSWFSRNLTAEEKQYVKYIDLDDNVKELHYHHLHDFLESQIELVVSQQTLQADTYHDYIDEEVAQHKRAAIFKKCHNCSFDEVPKKKLTCPNCKASLTKATLKAMGVEDSETQQQQPTTAHRTPKEKRVILVKKDDEDTYRLTYDNINTANTDSKCMPSVSVQEPIEVNPCSYDAVKIVLRTIGLRTGASSGEDGRRKWLIILCDGVPYNLCRRIVSSSQICDKCHKTFNGMDEFSKHSNSVHVDEDNVSCTLEFGWVLLQPGPGHIEMNMVKGIVELTWDVFWRELAILMNFKSESALACAKKVSDHHKGWTLCRISRIAVTQELILPFVRQQLAAANPNLSASAFLKFVMNCTDPNYTFMCDIMFELLDSIFMYRAGQRCTDAHMMIAARAKFAKLWCGRIHPLYRELEMSDSLQFMRMPKEVQVLVMESMSLNLSGRPNTGEGADFRLEEVNRQVQQWLPGNPTLKDWHTACSNYDELKEFRKVVFDQMGVTDQKLLVQGTAQNIDLEVRAFRTKLRENEYLLHPMTVRNHTSLSGEPLDDDLRTFCQQARDKRASYFESYLMHETVAPVLKCGPPVFSNVPVFITESDRENHMSIENMTISDITTLVEDRLVHVGDTDMRHEMHTSWQKLKSQKKSILIDFYLELCEYIDNEEFYTTFLNEIDQD